MKTVHFIEGILLEFQKKNNSSPILLVQIQDGHLSDRQSVLDS